VSISYKEVAAACFARSARYDDDCATTRLAAVGVFFFPSRRCRRQRARSNPPLDLRQLLGADFFLKAKTPFAKVYYTQAAT